MEAEIESSNSPVRSSAPTASHGSLGSSSPNRETPATKKKHNHGSLPLKMFVSIEEEKEERPKCANASNPFHKCADYCSQVNSRPEKQHAINDKRLGGSTGAKKVEAKRHIDPNCRYSSNPYHSCGPYCYQNIAEKVPADPPLSLLPSKEEKKQGVKIMDAKNVDPRCKKSPEIDRVMGGNTDRRWDDKNVTTKGKVDPNCINASNPYHVCGSYCLPRRPGKDDHHAKVAVSNQSLGDVKKGEQSSNCKYASNPYHNCDEYCSKATPNKNHVGKRETSVVPKVMEKGNIPSSYVNTPTPRKREVKDAEADASEEDVKLKETEETSMKSSSVNDNCREPCSLSFYEDELLEKVGILIGAEEDVGATEGRDKHLKHIDSFDLNHACIGHIVQRDSEENQFEQLKGQEDHREEKRSTGDHECLNEHDLYKSNATYCLQKLPESNHSGVGKTFLPPSSPLRIALLFISVLYYIAHVIVTGGVAMETQTGNTKFEEFEKGRVDCTSIKSKEKHDTLPLLDKMDRAM